MLSNKIHLLNPTAIYTSPYKRCVHTTNILNKEVKIPVIEDARLNEYETSETFKEFLERNMNCIDDIINKYNEDDTVICVTSGINLTAFVCYFTGVEASSTAPRCQGLTMSPVLFTNDKKVL